MMENIENLTRSDWSPSLFFQNDNQIMNDPSIQLSNYLISRQEQTKQLFNILFSTDSTKKSNSRSLLVDTEQKRIFKDHRNDSFSLFFNLNNVYKNQSKPMNIPIESFQDLRIDHYLLFKHVNLSQPIQKNSYFQFKMTEYQNFLCQPFQFVFYPTNLNASNRIAAIQENLCNLTLTNTNIIELNNMVNKSIQVDYYNKIVVDLYNKALTLQNGQTESDYLKLLETNLNEYDSILKAIGDLSALSVHFPHGQCDASKIMKEGDRRKNERKPESIMSDTRDVKYDQTLKSNHGFLGIWTNMQKTFCGAEPSRTNSNRSTSSEKSQTSTGSNEINLSKDQIKTLSLIINVVYSNPVILFSPNTSVIKKNLIQKANTTFELLNRINLFCRQWLDQSAELIDYLRLNNSRSFIDLNKTNMSKLNSTNESLSRAIYSISSNEKTSSKVSNQELVDKIEIIDSAACSWLTIMSGVNLDIFKGFANEHDLVDYFLNHAYSKNQTVIASLVFEIDNTSSVSQDRLAPHIKYKIRQNASFTYTTKKIRERYWYPSPRDWVNILFKRIIRITLEDQFNSKLFLKKACKIIFWSLILHTF